MPAQKKQNAISAEPEAFNVPTAALIIGSSTRVVWELIKKRQITHFRIGRKVLISRAALDEYVQRNTIPAIDAKAIAREMLG